MSVDFCKRLLLSNPNELYNTYVECDCSICTKIKFNEIDLDVYLGNKKEIEMIEKKETINHPSHYNKGIEVIEFIDSWDLGFYEGNIIKYVTRYPHKNGIEDLKKAKWYLDRLIHIIDNKDPKDPE